MLLDTRAYRDQYCWGRWGDAAVASALWPELCCEDPRKDREVGGPLHSSPHIQPRHIAVLHFNVTEFPSAQWTGQQIIQAFPEDKAPKYMIRDRDGIYGDQFRRRVEGIGIEEVLTAPQ